MKLDPLQGEGPMSDAHNDVVGCVSADGEFLGKTLGVYDQGVIRHGWQGVF